jgi:hypothetical protein
MWDLVTVKNSHKLLVEFPIKHAQPRSGVVVNNTILFLQVSGSNPCHGKLFLQHYVTWPLLTWWKCLHVGPWKNLWRFETLYFQKKSYMWDPTEFYDDLGHSIFKIMLTCGTKVGLWRHCRAYGVTNQAWNRECSAALATIMTKVFCH